MTYFVTDARAGIPGLLIPGKKVASKLKPDLAHPLAKGLKCLCIGDDIYDFADKRRFNLTNAVRQQGSWFFNLGDWLEHSTTGTSGPITLGAVFIPNVGTNSNGRRVIGIQDDSSTTIRAHISIQYNGTTTNSYRYAMNSVAGGINVDINVNNAAFNGTVARVGAIERWTAGRVMYSVGEFSGSATNATSRADNGASFDIVSLGTWINAGTTRSAANEMEGWINIAAIWDRDIGEDALKSWLRNPNQMLIPR